MQLQCTHPKTVGFKSDGKTISWSQKTYSKEFPTFQLPCGKCIACRLEYSRQWAIRCVHEAQMHPNNCFITLTYSDENLTSPKLEYRDFQLFMKRLRFKLPGQDIGVFVTGEYGEQKKRPHWHAIIFNWHPPDAVYKYSNERGDKIYSSKTLQDLWGLGVTELGSVTFESAGYCARYAAKKLVHGHDQKHDFHPISKKSCKHAIGKKFLEKHWQDIFNAGFVLVEKKDEIIKSSIPRYYEKWLKKNQPEAWEQYVTIKKANYQQEATKRKEKETEKEKEINFQRSGMKGPVRTRNQARKTILDQKFKQLQTHLKL